MASIGEIISESCSVLSYVRIFSFYGSRIISTYLTC